MIAAKDKGVHTSEDWDWLVSLCSGVCVKCGAQKIEKDHILPVYSGGSDALEDLQPLCAKCNSGKGPDAHD
jgi:5-methylcytosine-specific restriction endonuclease McrA